MSQRERRVLILGATGSIGRQAADVIEHLNGLYRAGAFPHATRVVGLAARRSAADLFSMAQRLACGDLALVEAGEAGAPPGVRVRTGPDAAERLVREVEADVVLAAMVGAAGLPAALAAAQLGRDIALANKETLVAGGALVVPAARASGARLLPVDSEHAGIWQCLGAGRAPPIALGPEIARVVLTASGGPFRTTPLEAMRNATLDQALDHPTWRMGRKVTIDSASLMNKGLELIEAHWLFGLEPARLGAVVHPQSIVHAMVERVDGSIIAQLAAADMRGPIQHAIAWPAMAPSTPRRLDPASLGSLTFEPVDPRRFPAVGLALRAIEMGGSAGAVLNAANEEAVEAFVQGRIRFTRIAELVEAALDAASAGSADTLSAVLSAEAQARRCVRERAEG